MLLHSCPSKQQKNQLHVWQGETGGDVGTLHIRKSRRGQHDAGNITLFLGCVILKQNYCVSYKSSKFKSTQPSCFQQYRIIIIIENALSFQVRKVFSNKEFNKTHISLNSYVNINLPKWHKYTHISDIGQKWYYFVSVSFVVFLSCMTRQ